MICRMKSMEYPLIHRGYLYYFSVEWSVKEEEEESQDGSMNDGVMENIGLHRMNIEKRNPKDEIVYRREGDHGFSAPQAYGKRIWFNTIGDQGKRRVSLIYNLETGQVEETGMEFPTIQVFQDKCYLKPYDQTKGDLDTTTLVEIDVYGNPVKTVLEGIIQISELMSDKNYFYISNAKIGILHPDIEFEETCQVYDKDFQLVDELKMPDVGYSFRDVPMGGDNYQYLLYSDEESGAFGLRIFDKSKIGSIKGNNCTYTIVKYGEEGEEQDIVPASAEESETPEMTPEYKISETSLNQEVSLSYSEPEDRQILGKMKKKHYLDTFSNDLIEAQVSYTVDKVKAVVTKSPMPLPEGPDYEIVLGQRYTIITTLFGYYTKGGRTFVRSITMTSINTTEPDVAELELPEDADEFIGVKAVIKGEFLRETWEPPSPEEGRVHNIWPPDIESYKDTWGCYDGKVAE